MNIPMRRPAAGFTLVEMLVVIAIIGVLAGLVSVAAVNALNAAKDLRIKSEVDQLDMALKSFKQQYGAYPPMNLTCPSSTPNAALQAFVAQAFPRYAGNLYTDLTTLNVDTTAIHPDRALVFWLSGFSPDVTSPFTGAGARTPLFNFDQTRLYNMNASPPTSGFAAVASGPNSSLGYYAYVPQGSTAPYAYFDSGNYGTMTVGTSPPLTVTCNSYSVTSTTGTTQFVTPYVLDANNSGTINANIDTFCNPTTFQIIAAGQDGLFGTATSHTDSSGTYKFYPTGSGYDAAGADLDNETNFNATTVLGNSLPN